MCQTYSRILDVEKFSCGKIFDVKKFSRGKIILVEQKFHVAKLRMDYVK